MAREKIEWDVGIRPASIKKAQQDINRIFLGQSSKLVERVSKQQVGLNKAIAQGTSNAFQFGRQVQFASKRLLAWAAPAALIFSTISSLRDAVSQVVKLDTQARRLAFFAGGGRIFKNTSDSVKNLTADIFGLGSSLDNLTVTQRAFARLGSEANRTSAGINLITNTARKLGLTLDDVTNAVLTTVRVGQQLVKTTDALAKSTAVADSEFFNAVVSLVRLEGGILSATDAVRGLTAIQLQFVGASKAAAEQTGIFTKFAAALAATSSTTVADVKELTEATRRVGSAFKNVQGINFDQTLAFLKVGFNVTGASVSRLSTGLRRLTTFAVKNKKAIQEISGIQVIDSATGQIKGLRVVLDLLERIRDTAGTAVSEELARALGGRNIEITLALAKNIDILRQEVEKFGNEEERVKFAVESTLALFDKNKELAEGLAGSINRLKAAFVNLVESEGLRASLKFIINGATSIIDGFKSTVSLIIENSVALKVIGLILGVQIVRAVWNFVAGLKDSVRSVKEVAAELKTIIGQQRVIEGGARRINAVGGPAGMTRGRGGIGGAGGAGGATFGGGGPRDGGGSTVASSIQNRRMAQQIGREVATARGPSGGRLGAIPGGLSSPGFARGLISINKADFLPKPRALPQLPPPGFGTPRVGSRSGGQILQGSTFASAVRPQQLRLAGLGTGRDFAVESAIAKRAGGGLSPAVSAAILRSATTKAGKTFKFTGKKLPIFEPPKIKHTPPFSFQARRPLHTGLGGSQVGGRRLKIAGEGTIFPTPVPQRPSITSNLQALPQVSAKITKPIVKAIVKAISGTRILARSDPLHPLAPAGSASLGAKTFFAGKASSRLGLAPGTPTREFAGAPIGRATRGLTRLRQDREVLSLQRQERIRQNRRFADPLHPLAPASTASKGTKVFFGGPNTREGFAGRPTRVGVGAPVSKQIDALKRIETELKTQSSIQRSMSIGGTVPTEAAERLRRVRAAHVAQPPTQMALPPGAPRALPVPVGKIISPGRSNFLAAQAAFREPTRQQSAVNRLRNMRRGISASSSARGIATNREFVTTAGTASAGTRQIIAQQKNEALSLRRDFAKNIGAPLNALGTNIDKAANKIGASKIGGAISNTSNSIAKLGNRIGGAIGSAGGAIGRVGSRIGRTAIGGAVGFAGRTAGRGIGAVGRGIGGLGSTPGLGSFAIGTALTAVAQPLEDAVSKAAGRGLGKGLGEAARGAGLGAMLGGPLGAAAGAAFGFAIGAYIGVIESEISKLEKTGKAITNAAKAVRLVAEAETLTGDGEIRRLVKLQNAEDITIKQEEKLNKLIKERKSSEELNEEAKRLKKLSRTASVTTEQLKRLSEIELIQRVREIAEPFKVDVERKRLKELASEGKATGKQLERLTEIRHEPRGDVRALEAAEVELATHRRVLVEKDAQAERDKQSIASAKARIEILKNIQFLNQRIVDSEGDINTKVSLTNKIQSEFNRLKTFGFETSKDAADLEFKRAIGLEKIVALQKRENDVSREAALNRERLVAAFGGIKAFKIGLQFDKDETNRQVKSLQKQLKVLIETPDAEFSQRDERQKKIQETRGKIADKETKLAEDTLRGQERLLENSRQNAKDQIDAWSSAADSVAGAFRRIVDVQDGLAQVFARIGENAVQNIAEVSRRNLSLLEASGANVERRLTAIRRGAAQQLATVQGTSGRQLGTTGGISGGAQLTQIADELLQTLTSVGRAASEKVVDEENKNVRVRLATQRQLAAEQRQIFDLQIRNTQREIEIKRNLLTQEINIIRTRAQQEEELFRQRRDQQIDFGRLLLESPEDFKQAIKDIALARRFTRGVGGGAEGISTLGGRIRAERERGDPQLLLRVLRGIEASGRFGGPELVGGTGNTELQQLFQQLQLFSPESINKQRGVEAERQLEAQKQIQQKQARIQQLNEFDVQIQKQLLRIAALDAQVAVTQRSDIIKELQIANGKLKKSPVLELANALSQNPQMTELINITKQTKDILSASVGGAAGAGGAGGVFSNAIGPLLQQVQQSISPSLRGGFSINGGATIRAGGVQGGGRAVFRSLSEQQREGFAGGFRATLQQTDGEDTAFVQQLRELRGRGAVGRRDIDPDAVKRLLGSAGFGDVARGITTRGKAAKVADTFIGLSEQLSKNTTELTERAARSIDRLLVESFGRSMERLNEKIDRSFSSIEESHVVGGTGRRTTRIGSEIKQAMSEFKLFKPEEMDELRTTIHNSLNEALNKAGKSAGEIFAAEIHDSIIRVDIPEINSNVRISVANAISSDEFARQLAEQLSQFAISSREAERIHRQISRILEPLIKAGMITRSPEDTTR